MKRLTYLIVAIALASAPAFAADKKVERVFKSKCASCHGNDGKADTEKGKKMKVRDMTTAEYQKATDDQFRKAIAEGVKEEKDGVKKEMDPYKDELKPDQIDGLVAMIREFGKK